MTGTFDDWAKSVKLDKKGEGFEKLVELPATEENILYKVRIVLHIATNNVSPQGKVPKALER